LITVKCSHKEAQRHTLLVD